MLILGLSDTRFPFQKKTLADQERMTINAQRSLQRFYVQKNSIPCLAHKILLLTVVHIVLRCLYGGAMAVVLACRITSE